MSVLGANEAIVNQLVNYIKDNIPEINKVYLEWPNYQENLEMPCLSAITVGSPEYTHQMPVLRSYDDAEGKSEYYVGFYDITVHLDIWAEYKQTRGDIMEKVFDLFHKQWQELNQAMGISLTLEDYYNVIARYDLNGYTYMDNEESSQRDEWRAKIVVLVNCPRVLTKIESKMTEITLDHDISDDDSDTDEDLIIT
jgi:hypothetical protein